MGLQALSAFNVDQYNKTTKTKVRVRKPRDANRDLGGPPGVVGIGDEYLIIEEHITPAERYGFSIEWNSNPDARAYSRRYIDLNQEVNDLQLGKEVLLDVSQLLEALREVNQLWSAVPEDPGEVFTAAQHFLDELNARFEMIPKSVGKLTTGIFREIFNNSAPPDISEVKLSLPDDRPPGGELMSQQVLDSFEEFAAKARAQIDEKLRDLESDVGFLVNHKVFHYEPDLSIHDAMEANESVDELIENIAMHGGDALQAQANQVPELAANLLMNT